MTHRPMTHSSQWFLKSQTVKDTCLTPICSASLSTALNIVISFHQFFGNYRRCQNYDLPRRWYITYNSSLESEAYSLWTQLFTRHFIGPAFHGHLNRLSIFFPSFFLAKAFVVHPTHPLLEAKAWRHLEPKCATKLIKRIKVFQTIAFQKMCVCGGGGVGGGVGWGLCVWKKRREKQKNWHLKTANLEHTRWSVYLSIYIVLFRPIASSRYSVVIILQLQSNLFLSVLFLWF